jgi:hypothetical protein
MILKVCIIHLIILKGCEKYIFTLSQQLGPSIFLITFISIKILQGILIKALHTLHVPRLNLQNKRKKPLICSYNKIDMNQHCHMCKILRS